MVRRSLQINLLGLAASLCLIVPTEAAQPGQRPSQEVTERRQPAGQRQAGAALQSGVAFDFTLPASASGATLYTGVFAYTIDVPAGATELRVDVTSLTSGADIDMYVRRGADPSLDASSNLLTDFVSETFTGTEFIRITPSGWSSASQAQTSTPTLQAGTYHIAFGLFTANLAVNARVTATVTGGPGPATGLSIRLTQEDNSFCPAQKKLFASVLDNNGQVIQGLGSNNFTLVENGVTRQVTVVCSTTSSSGSASVAILIDASGSLSSSAFADEKTAAKALVDLLGPNDNVAVYSFASQVVLQSTFTTNKSALKAAIDAIPLGGNTALYSAIQTAAQALESRTGRKAMVLMTDGENTVSGITIDQAISAAKQASVPVYSVGFGGFNQTVLTQISSETGGSFTRSATSADLQVILTSIGQALNTLCEITYAPSNAAVSATVTVTVTVVLSGVTRTASDTRSVGPCTGSGGATGIRITLTGEDNSFCPAQKKLFASVTDNNGQVIQGLGTNNFTLVENGVTRQVTVLCRTSSSGTGSGSVAILIDASGSLSSTDLANEKTAAKALVDLLGATDSVAVWSFASSVVLRQDFTIDKATAKAAIDAIPLGGSTALYAAIRTAAQALATRAQGGPKAIVLMTDGENTVSGVTIDTAISEAQQAGTPVFSVGFGGFDEVVLTRISNETGGRFTRSASSADLQSILSGIGQLLTTLCEITYAPASPSVAASVTVTITAVLGGVNRTGSATRTVTACSGGGGGGTGTCPSSTNIALNRLSAQSTGAFHGDDPGLGNDGVLRPDYDFHTALEDAPWWQVDFGSVATLCEARLFNRVGFYDRARSIRVLVSNNGVDFTSVYQHNNTAWGDDANHSPLIVQLNGRTARYLRVQLGERNYLHLREVEVYGFGGTSGGGGSTTQPGCNYFVQPLTYNFGPEGGTAGGSGGATNNPPILISTAVNCAWSSISNNSWIRLDAGKTGLGSGAVSYTVSTNPTASARTGTVTIAGTTHTVNQEAGVFCDFSISPNSATVSANGGFGTINVTATAPSCLWTAGRQVSWITFNYNNSTAAGTGSGSLRFEAERNPNATQRTGVIIVAGLSFTVTQLPAGSVGDPSVPSAGVVPAGSGTPPSLPGGALAQGSFFTVFGFDIGPSPQIQVTSFPLPTSFGGTQVILRQGSVEVFAFLVFASASQVNGVIPSNAPLGDVDLIVVYRGRRSPAVRVRIVRNNFNIFTTAAGRGPAIVTNFITATDQPLNTRSFTAKPGQAIIIWGTGGGPITTRDDLAPVPGNLPFEFDIVVGGKLQTNKLYYGRSSCCSALDQVAIILSNDVPLGCTVPIQVRAGGPGAPWSNVATIAISADGSPCSDPMNPVSTVPQTGGKTGVVALIRGKAFIPTSAGAASQNFEVDLGFSMFLNTRAGGDLGFSSLVSLPPVGSCQAYSGNQDFTTLLGGLFPTLDTRSSSTQLDAGKALTIRNSSGRAEKLDRADSSATTGPYMGLLGGSIPFPGLAGKPAFLAPGDFTISGPGGMDVGAFSATIKVPAGTSWTNRDSLNSITRSQGFAVNWSGGAIDSAVFIIGAGTDQATKAVAYFVCVTSGSSGTFVVPPTALSNLPATRSTNLQDTVGLVAVGSLSLGGVGNFTAPGMDAGYVIPASLDVRTVEIR